jgi:hypothetical protein
MGFRCSLEGGLMFVELLDHDVREAMHRDHAGMTVEALVIIFGWSRPRAESAVTALRARYASIPLVEAAASP